MDPRVAAAATTSGWDRRRLADEVRQGLRAPLRELPCKYFYDDRGSALFDAITRLPEYYPTAAEREILGAHAAELAAATLAEELVELGAGGGEKTRLLLDALAAEGTLRRCALLDINAPLLRRTVARLARALPGVAVRGLEGDFIERLEALGPGRRRLVAFFGGTIGNLPPTEVPRFLARLGRLLDADSAALIGLDLVKERAVLEAAYDDAGGVTRDFNLNILSVMNRELDADFDPEAFEHVAFYDEARAWIEMRLRSRQTQTVTLRGIELELVLRRGEEIRTEISCKYTRPSFTRLLAGTGLLLDRWLTDEAGRFALALLRPGP